MSIKQTIGSTRAYAWARQRFFRALTRISPRATHVLRFKEAYGRYPDLDDPKWLSEKLMWLSLRCYDHSPLVKRLFNKYQVRSYLEEKGLGKLNKALYGLWDRVEDVPFDRLPDRCAVKATMGCGSHVFIRGKAGLDADKARATLRHAMTSRDYLDYAELQFEPSKESYPQVMAEELIETPNDLPPVDYKFYCFSGEPRFVLECYDRAADGSCKLYFADLDWSPRGDLLKGMTSQTPPKPALLDTLTDYARALCGRFPFVRVDFNVSGERVFFGELTFTPAGCIMAYHTRAGQELLGSMIDLTGAAGEDTL